MRLTRFGAAGAVALAGTLALSACGSDNNTAPAAGGTASGSTAASADCGSGTLDAEGSTAQLKAMQQAISAYQDACSGATINYNGTGSGAGVKQFTAKQVQFAGSDSALKTVVASGATVTELAAATTSCGSPALDIPLVAGAIGAAYNVSGVSKLNLDAATLAKIYKGEITTWNDPSIAATNSGVTLPSTAIKVFFRSDESGTTENLSKYLHGAASSVWTDEPSKAWKGTGEGKKGSSEVAKSVAATDGAIGYMEVAFATEAQLKVASINGLAPTGDALTKGVEAGTVKADSGDVRVSFDYTKPADGAYPIPIVTYELVCSKYSDATVGTNVKKFLTFLASDTTQQSISSLGYVPLPSSLKSAVDTAIATIS